MDCSTHWGPGLKGRHTSHKGPWTSWRIRLFAGGVWVGHAFMLFALCCLFTCFFDDGFSLLVLLMLLLLVVAVVIAPVGYFVVVKCLCEANHLTMLWVWQHQGDPKLASDLEPSKKKAFGLRNLDCTMPFKTSRDQETNIPNFSAGIRSQRDPLR